MTFTMRFTEQTEREQMSDYIYYKFSEYLNNKYGSKVYKLPINVYGTCPNRDGCLSHDGCIFCGEESAGFESYDADMPISEQIERGIELMQRKYKAEKYIAYLQNWSNTYCDVETLKKRVSEALSENVVACYISTRPDCIDDARLEAIKGVAGNADIVIELGIQSVNTNTLKILNRRHGLAEFIDAVNRIHKSGFEVCAHYIVDLPFDTDDDVIEGAKVASALGVEQVKCHSLFVLKDTKLGEMYENGKVQMCRMEDYVRRVSLFLSYLSPDIAVQRIIGRAPEGKALFCNWDTGWWKVHDYVEEYMLRNNLKQGVFCDYLNGKKVFGGY